MTDAEKIQYWIKLSDRDFNTAEYLANGGHNLHAGYLCHQAVEKIMKGYFTKMNQDTPPYTHNLIELAVKTGLYDLMSNDQRKFVVALNPLNIETRYPDYKSQIAQTMTKAFTQYIVTETREFLLWTKQMM